MSAFCHCQGEFLLYVHFVLLICDVGWTVVVRFHCAFAEIIPSLFFSTGYNCLLEFFVTDIVGAVIICILLLAFSIV